jgi:hypothetical protein
VVEVVFLILQGGKVMATRKQTPIAPKFPAPGARRHRKFRGDPERRIRQLRVITAAQYKATVELLVGRETRAREVLLAEAAKLREQLDRPNQTAREELVINTILVQWVRREAMRYYLNLPRWSMPEFKELQQRFMEAESAAIEAVNILRSLRAHNDGCPQKVEALLPSAT